jgi:hypothetical protein
LYIHAFFVLYALLPQGLETKHVWQYFGIVYSWMFQLPKGIAILISAEPSSGGKEVYGTLSFVSMTKVSARSGCNRKVLLMILGVEKTLLLRQNNNIDSKLSVFNVLTRLRFEIPNRRGACHAKK